MKQIFINIKNRWNAETPKLFKNIQRLGIGLATASTYISTSTIGLPVWLTSYAPQMAGASVVIALFCQFMKVPSDNADKP